MDGYQPSLHPADPVLHTLPPGMPLRDKHDVRMRVRNFRQSMKTCPECWRRYFEVMASEVEREMN